jgi:hypothetical protein
MLRSCSPRGPTPNADYEGLIDLVCEAILGEGPRSFRNAVPIAHACGRKVRFVNEDQNVG